MTWINLAWFLLNCTYLLAVIRTVGKRFDADFHAWQTRMHDVTVASVFTQTGKGTYHGMEMGVRQRASN